MSRAIHLRGNMWFQDNPPEFIYTESDPGEEHNCDQMGCNSVQHVRSREKLSEDYVKLALIDAALRSGHLI